MDCIRVVTLNLWNDREKPQRRLEVIAEGLRALEPDLVALQEVREGPLLAQASSLARMTGLYPAFGLVDPESPGGPVGNAVLSRTPVARWENHRLPGPPEDPRCALAIWTETTAGTVCLLSCHLSWEPHKAPVREKQVLALDDLAARANAPHVFMAGDFNCAPDSRVVRFLCGLDSLEGRGTFFRDCFARRHPREDGFTYSSRNPFAVRWIEQNRRIDYVFVRGPVTHRGEHTVEEARVVLDNGSADGTWPSDHFGVLAVVRLAPRPDAAGTHTA